MSKEIEMGQAIFGNPTGEYGTEDYVDAFIEAMLSEIDRVYWNVNQSQWDRHDDPKIRGVEFRPYCWNEESEEAKKPNFKLSADDQEIRWYKHPHRGQSCTIEWNEKQWRKWFDKGMVVIREADTDLFEN